MIIKGKSRSGPGALAAHLGNAEKNERVSLIETRGTVANDLRGALVEMDAFAAGTKCERPLYHAAISPGPPHLLTPAQRDEAIDALEAKLGLTGHARVVVLHEKLGRQHFHVVWSRIDLEHMKSISDSHNYRKHEEVARDLERRFGHERVQGAHHERDGVERPDRTPSRAELRQEERTGIKGKDVKIEVSRLYRASDTADAFKGALEDAGYVLAQGDQRDFIILDRAGGIHSLPRRIDGINAAQLRDFMSPIARSELPNSEQAKEMAALRAHMTDEMDRARQYGRGEDYASQATAALKDHRERQAHLDGQADAIRMFDYGDPKETEPKREDDDILRRQAEETTKRDQARTDAATTGPSSINTKHSGIEMTDAKRESLSRKEWEAEDDPDRIIDDDPDRQREAPGGGRTRGR